MRYNQLLILSKRVIEGLSKKIIFLLLFINLYFFPSSLTNQNYISIDFIPYQISKTSVGIKIYDDTKIKYSFLFHNWFSDNLYFNGSFLFLKNSDVSFENDMFVLSENNKKNIRYNLFLGYSYNFKNTIIKNFVFNIGYHRIRFIEGIKDNKSMSYALLLNLKIKPFWILSSFAIIDGNKNISQFSLGILKPVSRNMILCFGMKKSIINKNNDLTTPYLSLSYNI